MVVCGGLYWAVLGRGETDPFRGAGSGDAMG